MYREPAQQPKSRLPLLDRFTKMTPCKAPWSDMQGEGERPHRSADAIEGDAGHPRRVPRSLRFTVLPVTGEGAGTGLGLSISHWIVTSSGGTITHEPRPGGGTIFRVVLPTDAP